MNDSNITDNKPDFLSPLAATILRGGGGTDAYSKLTVDTGTSPRAKELLGGVTPAQLLTVPVRDVAAANAMLAGLWLWHDALHECHEIAQDLIGPTGSFWHAIMHRREGDFSNAKYWYARCADHRALRLISALALDVAGRETMDSQLLHVVAGEFDPAAFVDLVADVVNAPADPRRPAIVRLQQIEWEALFQHCAYEAAGEKGGMI